jgi:hypothetical protein
MCELQPIKASTCVLVYLSTEVPVIDVPISNPSEEALEQLEILSDGSIWCQFQNGDIVGLVEEACRQVQLIRLVHMIAVKSMYGLRRGQNMNRDSVKSK